LNWLLSWPSSIALAPRYRRFMQVYSATDLGYEIPILKFSDGLLIGYFQTWRLASNPRVFEFLFRLKPINSSDFLESARSKVLQQKPILLHVRLKDYVNEKQFGIPSIQYYLRSIESHRESGNRGPVWVISDDISLAEKMFQTADKTVDFVFFPCDGLTDLETWELMREFSGYIIGNSSYAWWAAFLRKNQSAKVVCPWPWFTGISSPNDLVPENWIKLHP